MNKIKSILDRVDKVRDEIVPCFIGEPGIGKTQLVYGWAKEHNRKVVEIIASQILPNEVSGLTMPDKDTASMTIYDHARLSSLKDGDILFFDELLQASHATLSACLTLIQERRLMSGKKLPDIMIVAAANPVESYLRIENSITQRFLWIPVKKEPEIWRNYITEQFGLNNNEREAFTPIIERWKQTMRGAEEVKQASVFNQLSPRTMTKLFKLFRAADYDYCWMKNNVNQYFNDSQIIDSVFYKYLMANQETEGLEKTKRLACEILEEKGNLINAKSCVEGCNTIQDIQELFSRCCIDWEELKEKAKHIELKE